MEYWLQDLVRDEDSQVQNANLYEMGVQHEATDDKTLAWIDNASEEHDDGLGDLQEALGALADATFIRVQAVVAASSLFFRDWDFDVDLLGVVPVTGNEGEDIL